MEATTRRFPRLPHEIYGRPEPAATTGRFPLLPHEIYGRPEPEAAAEATATELFNPVLLPHELFPPIENEQHSDYRFGFVPASSEAISSLEKITTADEAREVEGCCSVCLEDFEGGDELKKMPCSHVFHETCITDWLRVSHLCPLCRLELPTARRG
ncbi:hypothetical protein GUJ93_ZPchr0011g28609 [Zizania palustris]|uniref:RING-type domain-containing protein n=1 Tax=Zizania palustris TaxID=103762 RepID=A0A8J6BKV2_ZIZPA|nr:hypothetical protein GUJ93_ZPchr0011g28609 [Zizania palustris]